MEIQQKNLKKENCIFIGGLMLIGLIYGLKYTTSTMTAYNTTLFAISYKYGFISRGMLGTLYGFLDTILPMNLMTYSAVYTFTFLMTCLYYAIYFCFVNTVLELTSTANRRKMQYLLAFLSVFVLSGFVTEQMYGRLDLYLYMIMWIELILLLKEKHEWLIIPLSILAMCFHQGFVFTNANIILVFLLYKAIHVSEKELGATKEYQTGSTNENYAARKIVVEKKYLLLFALLFITISALFLYFELFSHPKNVDVAENVIAEAKALSESGEEYNVSIVNHEILGLDVFEDEWQYHVYNYQQFPVFLVLSIPYLWIAFLYFKRLLTGKKQSLIYWLTFLGAGTILPEMILKVDYSRYMNIIFIYYIAMTVLLLCLNDVKATESLNAVSAKLKEKLPVKEVVLVYILFYLPVYDVLISVPVYQLGSWLFPFIK